MGVIREVLLRPALVQPVGQRIQAAAMAQDQAVVMRAEGALQAIFHSYLQVHHGMLEELLTRGDANVMHEGDHFGQGSKTTDPVWTVGQLFDQGGFATARATG